MTIMEGVSDARICWGYVLGKPPASCLKGTRREQAGRNNCSRSEDSCAPRAYAGPDGLEGAAGRWAYASEPVLPASIACGQSGSGDAAGVFFPAHRELEEL
jgi:hypothetical protein